MAKQLCDVLMTEEDFEALNELKNANDLGHFKNLDVYMQAVTDLMGVNVSVDGMPLAECLIKGLKVRVVTVPDELKNGAVVSKESLNKVRLKKSK